MSIPSSGSSTARSASNTSSLVGTSSVYGTGLLPDRNVLGALARERLTLPAAPALQERHPGEPCHQVELRGPDVAKRQREELDLTVADPVVVRDQALPDNVVLVESEMRRGHVEGLKRLAGRKPPKPRYDHLDDEAAAGLEMRRDVLKAGDLLVLRGEVHDRVGDEVRDRERAVHGRRGEVPDRDADLLRARLGAEPCHHRFRQVDPVDGYPAARERERNPARADAQLER